MIKPKIKRLIVTTTLLISPNLNAQDPAFTCGMINGRMWNDINGDSKTFYLHGLKEANVIFATFGKSPIRLFSEEFTTGETKKALDQFYTNPVNVRIPVTFAINVVKYLFDGDKKGADDTLQLYQTIAAQNCQGPKEETK